MKFNGFFLVGGLRLWVVLAVAVGVGVGLSLSL